VSEINININGGWRPCSMRIELDPAMANEKTILGFLSAGRFYEPDVAEIFARVLREGDTVIDVGANSGFFTLLAAALVGPKGRVVSFEPDPTNIPRLRHNLEINRFEHVTLIERPAAHHHEQVSFFVNSDDHGGSALWDPARFPGNVRSQATPRVLNVQATTLDTEVERLGLSRVKLLKIDTEGAEYQVLVGARKLIAERQVPFVIGELHEFGLEQLGSNQRALRDEMAAAGYDSFMLHYSGALPRFVPRGTTIRSRNFCNVLFSSAQDVEAYWPEYVHDPLAT